MNEDEKKEDEGVEEKHVLINHEEEELTHQFEFMKLDQEKEEEEEELINDLERDAKLLES
jgi:hypothetical protein